MKNFILFAVSRIHYVNFARVSIFYDLHFPL